MQLPVRMFDRTRVETVPAAELVAAASRPANRGKVTASNEIIGATGTLLETRSSTEVHDGSQAQVVGRFMSAAQPRTARCAAPEASRGEATPPGTPDEDDDRVFSVGCHSDAETPRSPRLHLRRPDTGRAPVPNAVGARHRNQRRQRTHCSRQASKQRRIVATRGFETYPTESAHESPHDLPHRAEATAKPRMETGNRCALLPDPTTVTSPRRPRPEAARRSTTTALR